MKRATATNIDFAASSETIEPQSASAIEADTLVKKNAEETIKLRINVRDSVKMATPLIIINGKEIDSKELTEINPDDIHSINVLKDGSATKLYGEKGKGGVVIVETKGYKNDGASNFQELFIRTSSKKDVMPRISLRYAIEHFTPQERAYFMKKLIIIDGKETDVDIKDLNQETIHSVTVLKNDSLIKPYGEKDKNGVIIIETKKSEE
jgi:TonB-dependent SusC/RagA subfamily outer membrane receptor